MINKKDHVILLSCEHAVSDIPEEYSFLKIPDKILNSHEGYDIGALDFCLKLSEKLKIESGKKYREIKTFAGNQSRLLIDLNRSLHNRAVFSRYTQNLDKEKKRELIQKYYNHYRSSVAKYVEKHTLMKHKIIHLSIHSFTPVLNSEKRNAVLGILYDPSRGQEKEFAVKLKKKINDAVKNAADKNLSVFQDYSVRLNYPYRGTSDGLTSAIRKKWKDDFYLGIEIEINQKFIYAESSDFLQNILAEFLINKIF